MTLDGNLPALEPNPHAVIKPPLLNTGGWPNFYGAIELKLEIATTTGSTLDYPEMQLFLDDLTAGTFSRKNVTWNIKNGSEIVVNIISTDGALYFLEPRVNIVLNSTNLFTATPLITAIRYFDINGNEVAGAPISSYSVHVYP